MNAEFGTVAAMALLASAALFLIQSSPDESPWDVLVEKHSREIAQASQESREYHMAGDMQKLEASKISMENKLKEASLSHMGIRISDVYLIDEYYPFDDPDTRAERLDLEPSSVCAFERDIPLHMQKISQTENFAIFAKKYAQYGIELDIMDERFRAASNIHYGLSATDGSGMHAGTWFHIDSCTGQRTDPEPYFLICRDNNNDGSSFYSFNHKDIAASYSNPYFCKIELDPWRQSVYAYSETLREQRLRVQEETFPSIVDQASLEKFISGMDKWYDLENIVWRIVHGKFNEQDTQDLIKRYELQYGSLPAELLNLIQSRT